ncbi:MAG: RdgB/HAM1 family non-canonical purine NTP pyrophosphatase [Methanomicrobiales archaeon]|nr:RdgB/HAM1 family non-canonical purine NTP pyrophosphatase [Methanomicrobiales archaeon]
MKLAVVTGNPHKAREVAAYLEGVIEVEQVALDCPEFRHSDVGEIAKGKARFAFETLGRPLIVDDTAFCIEAWKGFPGPYAAYVLDTLGIPGILKLMEGVPNRNARFITAIGYADKEEIRVFRGTIEGRIVAPRGSGGFGYDPIFEVNGRTFAEVPLAEKSALSHRGKALAAFSAWVREKGT